MPFFNQDNEYPSSKTLLQVRKEVKESDALFIFSPEYNSSYPGILKNLIDYLSRPVIKGDYSSKVILNKKILLFGVAGKSKASGVLTSLRILLKNIGAIPYERDIGISLNPVSFTTEKLYLDEEDKKIINDVVFSFLEELK